MNRPTTPVAMLVLLTVALLPLPVGAQTTVASPVGACHVAGDTVDCEMHLHDNPLHIAPERIEAKVGQKVHILVHNHGVQAHDLIVCGDGSNPSSNCNVRWAFTPMMPPGQYQNVTFTARKAGTFDYFCDIPGHKAGGMKGTLTIQGDATSPPAASHKSPALGPALGIGMLALLATLRRRT